MVEPYTFADHSGGPAAQATANPYDALLQACADDPGAIQARYETHRQTYAQSQRAALLDPSFSGFMVDAVLADMIARRGTDPRHNLVLWARPTAAVRLMAREVQRRLQDVFPRE